MFTLQGPVNMQDRPVSVGRAGRRRRPIVAAHGTCGGNSSYVVLCFVGEGGFLLARISGTGYRCICSQARSCEPIVNMCNDEL